MFTGLWLAIPGLFDAIAEREPAEFPEYDYGLADFVLFYKDDLYDRMVLEGRRGNHQLKEEYFWVLGQLLAVATELAKQDKLPVMAGTSALYHRLSMWPQYMDFLRESVASDDRRKQRREIGVSDGYQTRISSSENRTLGCAPHPQAATGSTSLHLEDNSGGSDTP